MAALLSVRNVGLFRRPNAPWCAEQQPARDCQGNRNAHDSNPGDTESVCRATAGRPYAHARAGKLSSAPRAAHPPNIGGVHRMDYGTPPMRVKLHW